MRMVLSFEVPNIAVFGETRLNDFEMVMPAGAEVLSCIGSQNTLPGDGPVFITALVDTRQTETEKRRFTLLTLGQRISPMYSLRFIGVVHRVGRLPLHVFEVGR